jgi:hypothetical protein
MAFISVDPNNGKHDIEAELKKGEAGVIKALATAKKAVGEVNKFEHEARKLHDEAAAALTEIANKLDTLPGKNIPAIAAETRKHLAELHGQDWKAALGTESGVVQWVIRVFGDLKKAAVRQKGNPGYIELGQIIQGKLGPVNAQLRAMSDKFEAEFEAYGSSIVGDLTYAEILIPSGPYGHPEMVGTLDGHTHYNDLHDSVTREARYLLNQPSKIDVTLAKVEHELGAMLAHLKQTQAEFQKHMYGK